MWYAIETGSGREEYVRRQISQAMRDQSYDACRVLYSAQKKRYQGQWHDKKERFLPGYLFWVTKDEEVWNADFRMIRIDDILKIFGGYHCREGNLQDILERECTICPVKREEEEVLVRLTRGKSEIGMSYGVIRNGELQICDGVLMGLESRVRKIDRHKRKGFITISLHGRETMADIGLEITEKT